VERRAGAPDILLVTMHVLIAGCGWLGSEIARRVVAGGGRVTAVRRDPARAEALRAPGVAPLALDLAAPGAEARLPRADAVIACQAAGGESPEAYRRAYLEANGRLLAAAAGWGARFVYTGSTGVFGQRTGEDVDEATPPAPASPTAEVLAAAEEQVLAAARGGVRASLVRLSGLYGPGRAGILDRVRTGRLALGPGDGCWMNFCHLVDAAAAVLAALEKAEAGAVLHASDAAPARRREVIEWIAAQLGVSPQRDDTPFLGPDRRVLADRSRERLALALTYPSFRDGLSEIMPGRRGPGSAGIQVG
jgi:nucleoside-diphosphate-sugar epimerase